MRVIDGVKMASEFLEPVQSKYRIAYEDQNTPDEPVKILCPDPRWMAAALAGGLLPPVSIYLTMKHDESGRLLNRELFHDYTPIGPMSEEQAMLYLLMKDVPAHVWHEPSNRPRYKIISTEQIPTSRQFRDAFKLEHI